MIAFDTYSEPLLRYLADFTQDEGKARKILEEALWKWLASPAIQHVCRFTQLLQIARIVAIEMLQNDVTTPYEERKIFQFSDCLPEQEREIFSMNYFQGTSREDIAVTFCLSLDQVRDIIRKTLVDIRIQLDKKFDLDPRLKLRRIDH